MSVPGTKLPVAVFILALNFMRIIVGIGHQLRSNEKQMKYYNAPNDLNINDALCVKQRGLVFSPRTCRLR